MDLAGLRGAVGGEVLLPDSPGYDDARRPVMARFHDIRPRAVVRCQTAEDVAEALDFARRTGLRPAPRSGGHCFAGRSSTGGILIDVSPMNTVRVADGMATIGAGTRLGELYDELDGHGVTVPAGCGPTVGIAGLTLGGGIGVLSRRYGATCDSLRAARVVLAGGSVVDCDERHDAELFWALRGAGGGQFGVVTSLVFDTLPAPDVTVYHLVWPYRDAARVIAAWQEWAPFAPDEVSISLRVVAGADPARPAVVELVGVAIDEGAAVDSLLGRIGTGPTSMHRERLPYRATKRFLAGLGAAEAEPAWTVHEFSRSEFFQRPLPGDAIAALLGTLTEGRRAGQSRVLDFMPMGGAYNRVPSDATAFAHRGEWFLVEHVLRAPPGDDPGWVTRSWEALRPWGSGRVYPNFPDPRLDDWAEAYHGTNYERLRQVKEKYDPGRLFRFDQSL